MDKVKPRESSLELYRIIVMFFIVAHHYVVNSGLMTCIKADHLSCTSIGLLLFGAWGKVGIDCFVLITGYFMCDMNITIRKFMKLVLEVLFYNIIIGLIFAASGYKPLSMGNFMRMIFPITSLSDGFTSCFLVFFLMIPYLNVLVNNITQTQHRCLLFLTCGFFSAMPTVFPIIPGFGCVVFNYVEWFCILYFISSYLRKYPNRWTENRAIWKWMSLLSIVLGGASVIVMNAIGMGRGQYFWLVDSNKITALGVAICVFLYFKNMKIPYSPFINRIASTMFGVLLIHANSDAMRKWLWRDVCNNVEWFTSRFCMLHAVGCVLDIFIICIVIDLVRQRFIEKPLFEKLDKLRIIRQECCRV